MHHRPMTRSERIECEQSRRKYKKLPEFWCYQCEEEEHCEARKTGHEIVVREG